MQSRPKRQQGRPSDVAWLPSGRSLSPWEQDVPWRAAKGAGEPTMNEHLAPTVVEVHGQESSPALSHSAQGHHQTKSFAQLQQILIRDELVGAAADRARSRAESG
jgi:hypothetical protein